MEAKQERDTFPATYTLILLAVLMCGTFGSDTRLARIYVINNAYTAPPRLLPQRRARDESSRGAPTGASEDDQLGTFGLE